MQKIILWVLQKIGLIHVVTISVTDNEWHSVLFLYKRNEKGELYIDDLMQFNNKINKKTRKVLFKFSGKL